MGIQMWFDELSPDASWASLWSGYFLCENCAAIRSDHGACPVCGHVLGNETSEQLRAQGPGPENKQQDGAQTVTIEVNGLPVSIAHETATGAQIKRAAGIAIQQGHMLIALGPGQVDRVIDDDELVQVNSDSRFISAASATYMGAEGRYEDWIYLDMLQHEWTRPVGEGRLARGLPSTPASSRSAIVILFWSYFETKINRLLRTAMSGIPQDIAEDTLKRYSAIGARVNRVYKLLFQTSYWNDLTQLGYEDVALHLQEVQQRRNAFTHGQPAAIDDELVSSVVEHLKREHEAWIAAYNLRAVPRPGDHTEGSHDR